MRKLDAYLTASVAEVMTMCFEELASMDYVVMSDSKNFIWAVPTTQQVTPILYMAHMDTRRTSDKVLLGRHGDTIINCNGEECGCLGADDRAGVYVVLNIARNLKEKPYILLTTGEETGHTGAQAFLKAKHPKFLGYPPELFEGKLIWEPYVEDIYAVVQFDRKGFNEAAFYGTSQYAAELVETVENLGYTKYTNSRSDSLDVQVALDVAGVNLSVGFMHEHTPEELLLIPAVNHAFRTGMFLSALIDERIPLPHVVEHPAVPACTSKLFPATLPPDPDRNKLFQGIRMECDICGKKRPVIYIPHAQACVCAKCSTRAGGPTYITIDSIGMLRKELQDARDKSRLNNQKNKSHTCPICGESEQLSPIRGGVMQCKMCETYFLPLEDKVCYWSDEDGHQYCYFSYAEPSKVYEVTSFCPSIPLDWCDICGRIRHTDDVFSYNGFHACSDCDAIRSR